MYTLNDCKKEDSIFWKHNALFGVSTLYKIIIYFHGNEINKKKPKREK